MEGKHVKLVVRNNVGVVKINSPNSKVNVLNEEVMDEMIEIVKKITTNEQIVATVLISGKPGCFIAGADITMLNKFKTVQEGLLKSQEGQRVLNDIENSKKPVVAAIQGSCLGGGLEVALACHYRIAMKDKKTGLGLPEVLLGLLPGTGGTQRLPKLIGVSTSLDMLLTGRTVKATRAKEIGLVDELVNPIVETESGTDSSDERTIEHLENVAVKIAANLANGTLKPYRPKSIMNIIMDWLLIIGYAKDVIFGRAKAQVMEKSHGLYPAPLRILEVVRTGLDKGSVAGYDAEAHGFAALVQTPESQGLISLFHGQTECKKNRFENPERMPKNIAVLGAGLMGIGIAELSAEKGFNVILKSSTEKGVSYAADKVCKELESAKNRQRITAAEHEKIISDTKFQLDYMNFDKVDIVIESVHEDLDIKRRKIAEVEAHIPDHCIIASNTIGLSITKISQASKRPDKIVGMHYFSPVGKMQLLEIITAPETSKETIATAVQVGLKQGKVVIIVKDGPGFYTTRLLGVVVEECIHLLQEGVDPKKVDKITTSFGFPVGACTLIDEIGLDVCLHIYTTLKMSFESKFSNSSPILLEDIVKNGNLGRKSGKGFFMYEGGKKDHPVNPEMESIFNKHKLEPKLATEDEDVLFRIVTRFVNEALLCLEEQTLTNALEGDIGAVFGLGFPPLTGGPFHFVDSYGAQNVVYKMRKYTAAYGMCFTPCQLLLDHASDTTKRFFPKK